LSRAHDRRARKLDLASAFRYETDVGMKLIQTLVAFLACFNSPAVAQTVTQSPRANGLVIYKEQGFHTDSQARLIEYVSAKVFPQMATLILKTGNELNISAGKSPFIIPFPNESTENPDAIVRKIDSGITRFPQYKRLLEKVKADWLAKIAFQETAKTATAKTETAETEKAKIAVSPVPTEETPKESESEIRFRDGIVTKVYPDGLMVSSEDGLRKIPFSSLSEEEKTRFGYDSEKEQKYLLQKRKAYEEEGKRQQEVQPRQVESPDAKRSAEAATAATLKAGTAAAATKNQKGVSSLPSDALPPPPGWKIESAVFAPRMVTRDGHSFNNIWIREAQPGSVDAHLENGQSISMRGAEIPASILTKIMSPVELICNFGLVANTYSDLRSWDEGNLNEKGASYRQLAKDPLPGSVFARVRPGFIVLHMSWRTGGEFAGSEILKPFGGKRFSAVKAYDFTSVEKESSWWNDKGVRVLTGTKLPEPSLFQEKSPESNWTLHDPFDGSVPILSNRRSEMKKAWVAPSHKKLPFAIVETEGGYFLGYLSTADPLAQSDLTWEAAIRKNGTNWKLQKGNVKRLEGKNKILSLFDSNSSKDFANPLATLDQARVLGSHLARLLEGGMTALMAELSTPDGDGIESPPTATVEAETGPGFSIERVTDEISVMTDTWNPSTFRFQVVARQRVRESEIKVVSGSATIISKPWRHKDRIQPVEIPPDLDGGIRFTNGKKLIELIPDRFGKLTLIEWLLEENRLKK